MKKMKLVMAGLLTVLLALALVMAGCSNPASGSNGDSSSGGGGGGNGGNGGNTGSTPPTTLSGSASAADALTKLEAIIAYCTGNSSDTNDQIKSDAQLMKAGWSAYSNNWSSIGSIAIAYINNWISRLEEGGGYGVGSGGSETAPVAPPPTGTGAGDTGVGTTSPGFPAAIGKLTIQGLSSYNGKYAVALGEVNNGRFIVQFGVDGKTGSLVRNAGIALIANGQVEIPLYIDNKDTGKMEAYRGNDADVGLYIIIAEKLMSSTSVAEGEARVSFTNGSAIISRESITWSNP